MAWSFTSATQVGTDGLRVVIGDGTTTETMFYGYPFYAGQTAPAFRAAVRKEVRAMLDHLNTQPSESDVSSQYEDL